MTKKTILHLTQPIWSIATLELHGNFAVQQQQSLFTPKQVEWTINETPKIQSPRIKKQKGR
jgi:hypothetical protein